MAIHWGGIFSRWSLCIVLMLCVHGDHDQLSFYICRRNSTRRTTSSSWPTHCTSVCLTQSLLSGAISTTFPPRYAARSSPLPRFSPFEVSLFLIGACSCMACNLNSPYRGRHKHFCMFFCKLSRLKCVRKLSRRWRLQTPDCLLAGWLVRWLTYCVSRAHAALHPAQSERTNSL